MRQSRNFLADLLLAIGESERHVELLRQILGEQPDFEPYAAFTRIDENRKGKIDEVDLLYFLEGNGISVDQPDIRAVFHKYDLDGDGLLSYNEFLELVLPSSDPNLRTIICQRPNYEVRRHEVLSYEVEYALSHLVHSEIKVAKKIEFLKEKIPEEASKDLFHEIDALFSGFIDFNNLRVFFKKLDIDLGDDEAINILHRIDRNDDGRIDFEEFHHFCIASIEGLRTEIPFERDSEWSKSKRGSLGGPNGEEPMEKERYGYSGALGKSKGIFASKGTGGGLGKKTSQKETKRERENHLNKSIQSYASVGKKPQTPGKKGILSQSIGELQQAKLSPSKLKTEYQSHVTNAGTRLQVANILDEEELARTILKFVELDRDSDKAKQELALRVDFNIFDFFECLDTKEKGFISARELKEGLEALDLYPDDKDLFRLSKTIDRDSDGRIRPGDLVAALCPVSADFGRMLRDREPDSIEGLSDVTTRF